MKPKSARMLWPLAAVLLIGGAMVWLVLAPEPDRPSPPAAIDAGEALARSQPPPPELPALPTPVPPKAVAPEAPARRELEAPGRELVGVVLDARNRAPVAGAHVTDEPRGPAETARSTITDGEGRFRFDRVVARDAALSVVAARYAELRRQTIPETGDVELVLHPAFYVRGWVRTHAGEPLPGVTVAFADPEGHRDVRTDARGWFSLPGIAVQAAIRIEAQGEGLVLLSLAMPLDDAHRPLELTMERAARLRGTVRGAEGRAGLELALVTARGGHVVATARAGRDGSFSFDGLSPSRYRLQRTALPRVRTVVCDLEEGQDRWLITELLPEGSLIGRCVNRAGFGLDAVTVRAMAIEDPEVEPSAVSAEATCNGCGVFVLTSLTQTHYRLQAERGQLTSLPLDVELRSEDEVTLVLEEYGVAHGLVLDAQNLLPIPEFKVQVEKSGMTGIVDPDSVNTSIHSGGRFTVRAPAGTYSFEVKAEGYAACVCPKVSITAGAAAPLRVLLHRPATLSGRVRTMAGGIPQSLSLYLIAEGSLQVATLGEDGAFAFVDLTPDTYELSVGSARRSLVPREKITLVAGVTIERDIVLPDLGTIDVEIVDDKGSPIAGAEVVLSGGEDRKSGVEIVTISTNGAGHALFEQLLPGSYDVGVLVFCPPRAPFEAKDRRSSRLVVHLGAGGREQRRVVLSP